MTILIKLTKKAGTTFIGLRGYTNAAGEIANHTLVVGFSYDNAKKHDLPILQAADATAIAEKLQLNAVIVQKALNSLIKTCTAPDAVRSAGQTEAYRYISNGVKMHVETGDLYLFGLGVKKKILQKGEYKKGTEYAMTKKMVEKELKLSLARIKNIKVKNGTSFKARGFLC